jgi:hypothetical protein
MNATTYEMKQKTTEDSASQPFRRRDLLRAAAAGVVVAAAAAGTSVVAGPVAVTAGANRPVRAGILKPGAKDSFVAKTGG